MTGLARASCGPVSDLGARATLEPPQFAASWRSAAPVCCDSTNVRLPRALSQVQPQPRRQPGNHCFAPWGGVCPPARPLRFRGAFLGKNWGGRPSESLALGHLALSIMGVSRTPGSFGERDPSRAARIPHSSHRRREGLPSCRVPCCHLPLASPSPRPPHAHFLSDGSARALRCDSDRC